MGTDIPREALLHAAKSWRVQTKKGRQQRLRALWLPPSFAMNPGEGGGKGPMANSFVLGCRLSLRRRQLGGEVLARR